MRYHVPFAHRQRTVPGPVYIGFDEPVSIQKRKRPFNWFGFSGMLMALISPFTLFLIAPLALLFSLIGMRRAPRGMAFSALILSLLATTALSIGIYRLSIERSARFERQQAMTVAYEQRGQIKQSLVILEEAKKELRTFRSEHNHQLPELDDGMMMTVRYKDAWDSELSYGITPDGCIIRSMGPDKEFNTSDDLTVKLDGQPMQTSLADGLIDD